MADFLTQIGQSLASAASGIMPHSWAVGLARRVINGRIERYGQMTQLTIDNQKKTVHVELMLAGEKEPITIDVGKYELSEGTITLSGVSVSREWMNALAQDLVAGKAWPVPADQMKWARMVL